MSGFRASIDFFWSVDKPQLFLVRMKHSKELVGVVRASSATMLADTLDELCDPSECEVIEIDQDGAMFMGADGAAELSGFWEEMEALPAYRWTSVRPWVLAEKRKERFARLRSEAAELQSIINGFTGALNGRHQRHQVKAGQLLGQVRERQVERG